MVIVEGKNYSIETVFRVLNESVNNAVTYINDYICHNTIETSNDVFSDVLKIENYVVDSCPINPLSKTLRGRKGIYVFIVEEEKQLSYDEVRRYSQRCNGSGFFIWEAINLQIGDHFYQGSTTSKSLLSRLNEHYSNRNDVSSMRLNSNDRLIVKDCLVVYVFPIRRELEDKSFFIKMIEKCLHIRYPALTGSSRV